MIKSLEDFEIEGIGPGKVVYRGCDHQAFHEILVVRGKGPSQMKDKYDLLEIVERVPREKVGYDVRPLPGRARALHSRGVSAGLTPTASEQRPPRLRPGRGGLPPGEHPDDHRQSGACRS